ncbi:MAG: hypothetical protein HY713_01215 [candidate division NC10 bacterium]|nr:hypothetical protein [candidate division NC10 bacterium]
MDETLFAGGYPRIFDQQVDPSDWLGAYIATYLERDVRTVLNVGDLITFQPGNHLHRVPPAVL